MLVKIGGGGTVTTAGASGCVGTFSSSSVQAHLRGVGRPFVSRGKAFSGVVVGATLTVRRFGDVEPPFGMSVFPVTSLMTAVPSALPVVCVVGATPAVGFMVVTLATP